MQLKPARIATPLRTIVMEYISDAALSQIEQDILIKYKNLHNHLYKLTNCWRKTAADARTFRRPQERIRQELNGLQKEVKLYRHLANFSQGEIDAMPEPNEKQLLDPQDLIDNGRELQVLFDSHHDAIWAFHDLYKSVTERNDQMMDLYEDFQDNYYTKLFTNYDDMVIDLIRFDDDFNDFNVLMDELTTLIYKTANEYKEVFSAYQEMVKEVDILFKRIEHVAGEVGRLRAGGMNRREELN